MDWIEDRAFRELDKRGRDAIVRVVVVFGVVTVLWWEYECRSAGVQVVWFRNKLRNTEDTKVGKESKVAIVQMFCTCKATKKHPHFPF